MSRLSAEERELLDLGFALVRERKHKVYRRERDGRTVVLPKSGSDWRGAKNARALIRRIREEDKR